MISSVLEIVTIKRIIFTNFRHFYKVIFVQFPLEKRIKFAVNRNAWSINKAIQAPCNPKPTGKAKNHVRVGRIIIMLINETIATKTVSPAPLRQPENITCEV